MESLFLSLNKLWPQVLQCTGEQIYLVAATMLLAIIIGVPLGILIFYKKRLKHSVLGIANIFQTIPSLALLAFLLPFLGIGVTPALVALSIYALLPIIRNTVTALETVDPTLSEAADGLGFTRWQKLRLIELPLSISIILAGIRTATAMAVGIATLAAFIGGGGLGELIYQGLVTSNNTLILLGAIPAAILALILDFIIGRLQAICAHQQRVQQAKKPWLVGKNVFAAAAFVGVVLISSSMLIKVDAIDNDRKNTIIVASKNSTEQLILANMIVAMLKAKTHLNVVTKFNLGTTQICQQAMLNGEIDIYPEYTGTGYVVVLKKPYKNLSPEQLYNIVKQEYQKKYKLTWLTPFGFNNTMALLVRKTFAEQHHIRTTSELKKLASSLILGVRPSFYQRPDAYPMLEKYYGLHFKKILIMNPGLLYNALYNKKVDIIGGADATNGHIIAFNLVILADDKHILPSYYAAPVVRTSILQTYPQIAKALAPLGNLIDNNTMQRLNAEVDLEKQTPKQVAIHFLRQKGLIA